MSLKYTICILYHEEIKKVYYEWIAFFIFVLVSSKWFAANKNCFKEFCNNADTKVENLYDMVSLCVLCWK